MKKLVLFILLLVVKGSTAQNLPCSVLPPGFTDWCNNVVWLDTLELAVDTQLIAIDTSGGCTTWQLGHSYKPVFDSATTPFGLVTDSILPYSMGLKCSFIVKQELASSFSPTLLFFEHKYQTDSLVDGGYIEFSCDHGQNWHLVNGVQWQENGGPPIVINYYNYAGLPDDPMSTLHDTIPSFTGSNGDWQWSGIQLIWAIALAEPIETRGGDACWGNMDSLYYRFTFESDSINTDKAGWMIRNIVIGSNDIGGAVAEMGSQPLKISPNPATENIIIELPLNSGKLQNILVYDIAGNLVLRTNETNKLDVSRISSGIYFVLAQTDRFIYREKMVKE